MYVFKIIYTGLWGGGMALVAATSEIEAFEIFKSCSKYKSNAEDFEVSDLLDDLCWDGDSCLITEDFYFN